MKKGIQPKKIRIRNRFKAIVAADFMNYAELQRAVEEKLKEEFSPSSFLKVMYGDFISGPKAEAIMNTVAELVKKPVKKLWPEIEEDAA